jgi:hypothetical protein
LLVGAAAGAAIIEELPIAVPLLAVGAIAAALAIAWHEASPTRPA